MRWLTLWGSLLAVCFAAVAAAAIYGARQDAAAAAREATSNLALMVATNVTRDLAHMDLSMRTVTDGLKRPDLAALSEELRYTVVFDRISDLEGVSLIVLTDASGRVVMNSGAPVASQLDLSHREYFQALSKPDSPERYVGGPIVSLLSNQWVVPVARRIERQDRSFGGVVVAALNVSYLEQLFRKLDLGPQGVIQLLRADGRILARYPGAPGSQRPQFDRSKLFDLYPAASAGHYQAIEQTDNIQRMYAYHAVGNFPLLVTVGLATTDIYAAWRQRAVIIGLILAASCLLTILLVWRLRRELRRRQSAERAALRNERRYRLLAENSVDTIVMSGPDGRVSYVSPAITDVLGWTPAEIEGRRIKDFVHHDHLAVLGEADDESDEPGRARTMTFPARHSNGAWIWLEARVRRLAEDIEGATYISNIRDVSGRKKAEQALEAVNAQLVAMAATDSLTNLSNRRRFDETLDREWRRAMRDATPLALLLIDADHFKSLNDSYGHQQGDVYLKSIARIIQDCIRRPGDMASRYGGEEFAVLLPNTGLDPAYDMAERIRGCIFDARIPHAIGADGVMTVSIGVYAQTPVDGQLAADLVKRADAALYAAKRSGRNRTCIFEGQLLQENDGG